MATATNASCVFVGQSGRTYQINMYTADTASYINKWSPSGVAGTGSLDYWVAPENVTLIDFAIPTGTTQTTMVLTESGATKNGAVIGFVPHLTTNSNRPKIAIPFGKGALIGATTI